MLKNEFVNGFDSERFERSFQNIDCLFKADIEHIFYHINNSNTIVFFEILFETFLHLMDKSIRVPRGGIFLIFGVANA